VPQNTLVVADTLGFHARGLSARSSVRLEIWAYGRRNPFLPWLGFDLAAMPFVKGRAVPLYWSAMDLGEKLQPWQQPMAVCRDNKPRCASRAHILASTKSVAPVGLERSESRRRVPE